LWIRGQGNPGTILARSCAGWLRETTTHHYHQNLSPPSKVRLGVQAMPSAEPAKSPPRNQYRAQLSSQLILPAPPLIPPHLGPPPAPNKALIHESACPVHIQPGEHAPSMVSVKVGTAPVTSSLFPYNLPGRSRDDFISCLSVNGAFSANIINHRNCNARGSILSSRNILWLQSHSPTPNQSFPLATRAPHESYFTPALLLDSESKFPAWRQVKSCCCGQPYWHFQHLR